MNLVALAEPKGTSVLMPSERCCRVQASTVFGYFRLYPFRVMNGPQDFGVQWNMLKNLFADLPSDTSRESFDNLLEVPGLRIERIVSHGQASPPGFWYEQDADEWVLVVQGSASLQIDGQEELVQLQPGDHYWLPAGLRHRVASTDPAVPTIWLAVHR